ncbi:glycine--tRNA ligase subunit beta [Carnobacterium divergens]|uniref:Glycine--tRNA ligase beta subunit n=1 Tax=Carnobacterium divergens DSM 20623 TaxID=1449336 RepID=A0A0R2HMU0_CARDV|nr:glycine--tRNA ligase subunit beta [Carnobacterium divergens]KRN54243.1 glycyl-tRNA synthetase, beta subunit [Carnobacterium divergens DSM 20623]MDO0873729.1 glycine--tRNA ligase subunit beta [Carnobacterium divergens]SUX19072.1 Glycine--tRNA ligase beta subunit [Carnobacterium divergens]
MAKDLLLEIGLEEMPAQYVSPSSEQLAKRVADFLTENKLEFTEIKRFSTPRRLAVIVKDVADKQKDISEVVKGPAKKIALDSEGNWSKAAMGFVKGQGLSVEDITFKELNGVEYVHVDKFTAGKPAKEILAGIEKVITSMTFPVSMHWANHSFKYIRPIHWITVMLDNEIIPFKLLDIETSNTSRGHRFLGDTTSFNGATDYEEKLKEQFVVANSSTRKEMIMKQIEEIAKEKQWQVSLDKELLEEVTNLVEYPTAFSGHFDEKYLAIPEEVLVTSMKEHQRYFEVRDLAGNLLPHFISVRNGNSSHIENVAKGNEKVLTARLDDGAFFYEEDQQMMIKDAVERLKTVTFHEKIGTMFEKMERVGYFAEIIGKIVGLTQQELTELKRASEIYKFDLVTNMVGEFPELQGIMGEKYALMQGEEPAVATAIREHYLPISSEGELPQSNVGAVLAIADKLDSVMSFFAVGMIPTGSNDPYALRRQAYGVVRIVENKGWYFPIETIRSEMITAATQHKEELSKRLAESAPEVIDFIKARMRQHLIGLNMRHDVIEAVLTSNQEDLIKITEAAAVLEKHLTEPTFKPTIEAMTRVMNLAKKGKELVAQKHLQIDPALFETASETTLFNALKEAEAAFEDSNMEVDYQTLESLRAKIEAFFDENMVMADNEAIRNNRLVLLMSLANLALSFANVDELIVK